MVYMGGGIFDIRITENDRSMYSNKNGLLPHTTNHRSHITTLPVKVVSCKLQRSVSKHMNISLWYGTGTFTALPSTTQ
jgi:hypothetical protein